METADLLVPFCEAASLRAADAADAVRKRLVVGLSFVNTRALHARLFDGHHLDWGGVSAYASEVAYTPADWAHLLALLDFVAEPPTRPAVAELVAGAAAGMRVTAAAQAAACGKLTPVESLRLCFARARLPAPPWDTLAKALLLCNLADVDQLASLQQLLPAHPAEQVAELVRFLSAYRHTQAEYTEAFAALLADDACRVRAGAVAQSLARRDARREAEREHAARSGAAACARPSITAVVEAKRLREGGAAASQDSFAAFCAASKIAASASARVKLVAYYLACLPGRHPDLPAQLARAVGGDGVVHAAVLGMAIVKPDLLALRGLIADAQHAGAPFDALRLFRERCVAASSVVVTATGRRAVHWSTAFRLYLAAYCRPEACKDLWAQVVAGGGLHTAPEAEAAVQAFVRQHPMALAESVSLLLALDRPPALFTPGRGARREG